ncbi:MAG: hypothetical protein ABJN65_01455 [Parasphingorhabdus sp.]
MKLSQTGTGGGENSIPLFDAKGLNTMPMQVQVEGTADFVIEGRVSPEAPWMEIANGSADILQSAMWVPYIRLRVTSGTGTAVLWVL